MRGQPLQPSPTSDAIWNRAASAEPLADRAGDRALHDVLEVHGYVMNGGLDHALDVIGFRVEPAAVGWDYLGRGELAELLREALRIVADMPDDREARQKFFIDGWSDAQAEAIAQLEERHIDDQAVEQAFLRRLAERPNDFAPLDA
jgi:hypothetical protein